MTAPLAVDSGSGYVDLPMPTEDGYKTTPHELTKSGRNSVGNLYKFRIAIKQTIDVEWGTQTPEDKNRILAATSGNSFQVRYFDTHDSKFKYGKFYRADDLAIIPIIRYDTKKDEFVLYNIKMSLVEF